MKTYYFSLILIFTAITFSSCNEGDKPIDEVFEGTERGAVLRNIEFINGVFNPDDTSSGLSVLIEEQDIEEGIIFDGVDVFLDYRDRTPGEGLLTSGERLLKTIDSDQFELGPNGLPRYTLNVSLEEVLATFNSEEQGVRCSDQINVRLELKLVDGRSFSSGDASASILTDDCFFKSSYRYLVPVAQPINSEDFTGDYFFETLEDTLSGGTTVVASGVVNIRLGAYPNERILPFGLDGTPFVLACDTAYLKIYESLNGPCESSIANTLLGPSTITGGVNPEDDGVFELNYLTGFEGFAGFGVNRDENVRVRFSKQ